MYQSLHISRDPTSDIMEFEIQNKLKFVYQDEMDMDLKKDVFIVLWLEEKARINKDLSRFLKRTIHRLIFRQSKNNILYLTVRKKNLTDKTIEQIKLDLPIIYQKSCQRKRLYYCMKKKAVVMKKVRVFYMRN